MKPTFGTAFTWGQSELEMKASHPITPALTHWRFGSKPNASRGCRRSTPRSSWRRSRCGRRLVRHSSSEKNSESRSQSAEPSSFSPLRCRKSFSRGWAVTRPSIDVWEVWTRNCFRGALGCPQRCTHIWEQARRACPCQAWTSNTVSLLEALIVCAYLHSYMAGWLLGSYRRFVVTHLYLRYLSIIFLQLLSSANIYILWRYEIQIQIEIYIFILMGTPNNNKKCVKIIINNLWI